MISIRSENISIIGVITPHLAWAAREARQRLMRTTAENVRAFLEERPQHLVNGKWLGK